MYLLLKKCKTIREYKIYLHNTYNTKHKVNKCNLNIIMSYYNNRIIVVYNILKHNMQKFTTKTSLRDFIHNVYNIYFI